MIFFLLVMGCPTASLSQFDLVSYLEMGSILLVNVLHG